MTCIGNYAYRCKLSRLLQLDAEEWLRTMERRNRRVSGHPVTQSNRKAWLDSLCVLKECAQQLPPAFGALDVIFEYVLPRHIPGTRQAEHDVGIRADVILVSQKTAAVLEFKQRSDIFIGHVRQARMYRTRLQKLHCRSLGMNKKAILVLTAGQGIREQYNRVSVRSRELLADEICRLFEPDPLPHGDIEGWLGSDFAPRPVKKSRQSD